MRAPEFVLIENLKILLQKLRNPSLPLSIELSEYYHTLTSAILAESKCENIDIKEILTLSRQFVQKHIEKAAASGADFLVSDSSDSDSSLTSDEDIEKEFISPIMQYDEKTQELIVIVFMNIFGNYRALIEEFCTAHNLPVPSDETVVVGDFGPGKYFEDGRVTLFRLEEIRRVLDSMLTHTQEELSNLPPIEVLPFAQHLRPTVLEIQSSIQESRQKLCEIIEGKLEQLRSIAVEKKYPEMTSDTLSIIIQKECGLYQKILRALDEPKEPAAADYHLMLLVMLQESCKQYRDLEALATQVELEFFGERDSKSDNRVTSRFGVIERMLAELIDEIAPLKAAAGFVVDMSDLRRGVDQSKADFSSPGTMKLREMVAKYFQILTKEAQYISTIKAPISSSAGMFGLGASGFGTHSVSCFTISNSAFGDSGQHDPRL